MMNELMDGIEQIVFAVALYKENTEAYKALGNIRVVKHPHEPFLLFNYIDKAVFEGTWNQVERVSRGLIVNYETGEIVARSFDKFFNLEERPETSLINLPDEPCEITAKMDGSLGILYWTPSGPAIATRGSFTGEQALWATTHLRKHYDLSNFSRNTTLLFEIIYPENRIVLNYGEEEALYLIGARYTLDGSDQPYMFLQSIAQFYGFPLTPIHRTKNIQGILPFIKTLTGIEGWVARFPDGMRVKIKTEEYLRLHRLVSHLNTSRVRDMLLDGSYDVYLGQLPDEFYREAQAIATSIRKQTEQKYHQIHNLFQRMVYLAAESRKTFALEVMAHHKEDSSYLFALFDKRDISPMIMKNLILDEVVV